jgi:hypothetical protein
MNDLGRRPASPLADCPHLPADPPRRERLLDWKLGLSGSHPPARTPSAIPAVTPRPHAGTALPAVASLNRVGLAELIVSMEANALFDTNRAFSYLRARIFT